MLLSLVYVSKATAPMSQAGLLALRDQSSEQNLAAQITGLLLHRDGTFLQDLEGPEGRVRALFARIRRDARHRDVTLVWTQPLEQRRFPRWTMAFTDVTGKPVTGGRAEEPLDPDTPEAAFVRELLDLFDPRG